jgi:hypothetical protein
MFAIYYYLLRTCTWKTGSWRGTAERIRYGLNEEISVSQINRYLGRLDNCGYISRNNVPGARGGYVILINNYAYEDSILRPMELEDWREIKRMHAQGNAQHDAYEMRMRCVGDAQHDACEMRSNPDVPDIPDTPDVLDVPNVQTRESELVRELVNVAAAPATSRTTSSKPKPVRGISDQEWRQIERFFLMQFKCCGPEVPEHVVYKLVAAHQDFWWCEYNVDRLLEKLASKKWKKLDTMDDFLYRWQSPNDETTLYAQLARVAEPMPESESV